MTAGGGFENNLVFAENADFSGGGASGNPSLSNGLQTDGQLWIGSTSLNAGLTHVNVGEIVSPNGTLTIGYDSPNITLDLAGGQEGVDSFALQSGTSPIYSDSNGLVTFNGGTASPGTNPVITNGTAANEMTLQVQLSQAIAGTDATKVGLSAFDSASFTVDANGFVGVNGSGIGETITGNSGGALSPTTGNWNIVTANSTVKFTGAASTLTEDFGLSNLNLGSSLPNVTTGTNNCSVGNLALDGIVGGSSNVVMGENTGRALTSGSQNVAMGVASLRNATTSSNNTTLGHNSGNAISTGNGGNTALGYQSLNQVTTGEYNTVLGYQAGNAYTTTESNNILIGNGVLGTVGESNTTRIGGSQTACYIDGIDGVNVGSVSTIVTEFGDQLGTATISALSGSKVSTAANQIIVKSPPYSDASATATSTSNTGEFVTGAYTRTLPASAGLEDGALIEYVCTSASALVIQAVGSQTIRLGNTVSSAAGTATSTAIGDSISLRFRATDQVWYATSSIGVWVLA